MAYEADKEYDVKIDGVQLIESASKGTKGLEFRLDHDQAGIIFHVMWLTPATAKRSAEILGEFGVTAADLKSSEFWESPEKKLDGQVAHITTELNEYNKNKTVKVKWFNVPNSTPKSSKKASPDAVKFTATLFEDLDEPLPF